MGLCQCVRHRWGNFWDCIPKGTTSDGVVGEDQSWQKVSSSGAVVSGMLTKKGEKENPKDVNFTGPNRELLQLKAEDQKPYESSSLCRRTAPGY
jgi:hypothetical protein